MLGSLTTEKEMQRTELPLCPRAGSGEWELWLHGANCPPHLVSDSRLPFGAVTKPAIRFRGVLLSEGFPLLPYGLLISVLVCLSTHWGCLESWKHVCPRALSGPHPPFCSSGSNCERSMEDVCSSGAAFIKHKLWVCFLAWSLKWGD